MTRAEKAEARALAEARELETKILAMHEDGANHRAICEALDVPPSMVGRVLREAMEAAEQAESENRRIKRLATDVQINACLRAIWDEAIAGSLEHQQMAHKWLGLRDKIWGMSTLDDVNRDDEKKGKRLLDGLLGRR